MSPDFSMLAAVPPAYALGWRAAALMVATFACREARRMRLLAVATNLAFIGYGLGAGLLPVLALHALLLPINLLRWTESMAVDRPLREGIEALSASALRLRSHEGSGCAATARTIARGVSDAQP